MKKLIIVVLLSLVVLVPCSEGGFRVNERGTKVWEALGGGWEVWGMGKWPMADIVRVVELKPREVDAARLYEKIVDEPGEWYAFLIKFGVVQKVVWTKDTKIVLIDREGKRYESQGCFFSPDRMQTQVYDCRRMSVVVTKETVYCHRKLGFPIVAVRFAKGSPRGDDVAEFAVVGAVEVPPGGTTK